MDRPSDKDVEYALEWFSKGLGPGGVLATEVIALRAELSETQAHLRSALDAGEAAERRVVELREDVKCREVERDGANERARMMLEQKDHFREELETERMRLAACDVAAHGAGDEHFANMRPEYDSDALRATRKLRATIARVEAAKERMAQGQRTCNCVEVIEEALRGEP